MKVTLNHTGVIPTAGGRATINVNTREIRIIATGLPEIGTINIEGTSEQDIYQVLWLKGDVDEERMAVKLGILKPGLDKTHFLNMVVSRETLREITGLIVTIQKPSAPSEPSDLLVLFADFPQPLQN